MKSAKPLVQVSAYCGFLVLLVYTLAHFFPTLATYFPFGGNDVTASGVGEFITGEIPVISWEPTDKAIRLALAIIGVVLLMEPVAWIYMGARRRKGRDQAFLLTLVLLPVVVAGIVLIVQNSLALAFSLAGIVAGVRFRLTLEDTLDACYIFVAIAVGLAAGIEALEIAVVITVFFNYLVLIFWELDYGEEVSANRWFTKTWMNTGEETAPTNSITPQDQGSD